MSSPDDEDYNEGLKGVYRGQTMETYHHLRVLSSVRVYSFWLYLQ